MTADLTDPAAFEPPPLSADRWAARIGWARMTGLALAFIGAASGLMMAVGRQETSCPPGKMFKNITCQAHLQVPEGVAIAAISLLLGILIVLAAWIATALLVVGTRQR